MDSTLGIIQKYIKLVEREHLNIKVKIISQNEKTGITGAWNFALKEVSGDVVHCLNSDDWYESGSISTVLEAFTKWPNADIMYGNVYFHPLRGNKYIRYCRPLILFPFLMPLAHPATFVRRSVFGKIGLFDETLSISSDYDFFYRCYKKKLIFRKIKKPLTNMQLGGAANSNRRTARRETLKVALKYTSVPILPYTAYCTRKLFNR